MSEGRSNADDPVLRLERVRAPGRDGLPATPPLGPDPSTSPSFAAVIGRWVGELRRRWLLACTAAALVLAPAVLYAVLAVPTYTAQGALQVSSRDSAINPLLELAGAGGPSQVETEVEIIKRREMVLAVLRDLGLHLVDPHQPKSITTDLRVALGGATPLAPALVRARAALASLDVDPYVVEPVTIVLTGGADGAFDLAIGPVEEPRTYTAHAGETVEDEALSIAFAEPPVDEGETVELQAMPDGVLLEYAMDRLSVVALGNARNMTNLVEVSFRHPDREIAREVVQRLMQSYLDQSLQWQALSASSASDFIAQQLELARDRLKSAEDQLRNFAEAERAVQLDIQAQSTIQSTAELETARVRLELQERAIAGSLAGLKRRGSGSANVTVGVVEDPVLAANMGSLSENETKLAVLRATLTEDHPQVHTLAAQVERQRGEVAGMLKNAQKNLASQRKELSDKVESAMGSLAAYPAKELQLARHMRDVEVTQRLYAFLLEKHQESEILEASTTTDKRIVEAAAIPHRKASPQRGKLVVSGTIGALMAAFGAVYLAQLLQRRIGTVKEFRDLLPFALYGTVPVVDGSAKGERLTPKAVWNDSHGTAAEAFRALAVSVSLTPAVPNRARIVQVTSSQPGEGKSTVIANLATALAKGGARVLLADLDLRRPVQHRGFGVRRSPGYSDLVAQGTDGDRLSAFLQHAPGIEVDVLTAGTRLPDTLGAVMGDALETMLADWSRRYDYVLLDSPPAFVADTSVVARHVDLLLVVGRPGVAERGSVRQALDLFDRVAVAKGLVLNGVGRRHTEYEYGSGYYQYAQRYGEPTEDRKAS
jgi:capsular exopolysaccharide synthesis family protein